MSWGAMTSPQGRVMRLVQPVHEDQLLLGAHIALVARVDPAVVQYPVRHLRGRRSIRRNAPGLRTTISPSSVNLTSTPGLTEPTVPGVWMHVGCACDGPRLGGTVDALQRHLESMEEAKRLGRERRAGGVADPRMRQTQTVPDGTVDDEVGQHVEQAPAADPVSASRTLASATLRPTGMSQPETVLLRKPAPRSLAWTCPVWLSQSREL